MMQKYEYVIYKGDEIICGGTRKECAEKLEVSEELISVIATNSHKKTHPRQSVVRRESKYCRDRERISAMILSNTIDS